MRRAARVDNVQAEVVAALRAAGCSVQSIAAIGHGVPDLVAARAGVNYLLECKTGRGTLTREEREWIVAWRGTVHIVRTSEEALAVVGLREVGREEREWVSR